MKTQILKMNLIIVGIFLFSSFMFGQNNMEDVVYLKNGSIVRGIIIEQIPNQNIKIKINENNLIVFRLDEIKKISKEIITQNNTVKPKITEFKRKGFVNYFELSYCPGIANFKYNLVNHPNQDYSLGFKVVNGYQLNEYLILGLGIGIDKYKNANVLPITIDTKLGLLKGKISPVLNLCAGYSIGLSDAPISMTFVGKDIPIVRGGIIINPSIGIKSYITKNVAYLFNIGYKVQEQELYYYQMYSINGGPYVLTTYTNQRIFMQFITLSAGFLF